MDKIKKIIDQSTFLKQVLASVMWLWNFMLKPILNVFIKIGTWFYEKYKTLWPKLTYKDGHFDYKRGGITIASTLFLIWMIPTLIVLSWQSTMYMTTYQNERVFLFHSEEIYPEDNIWSVRGCEIENCATESLYYRVSPTLFNQLWSLSHKGRSFLADDIASGVPPGKTECQVISYGIRIKTLMRRFEIYPDAVSIVCDGTRHVDK